MRKVVFQMMTTLNGRLDDPMAWLTGVSDVQYQAIDRLYAGYDTVLVAEPPMKKWQRIGPVPSRKAPRPIERWRAA